MRGTYASAHKKGLWAGGQNYGAGYTGGDATEGVDRRRVLAVRVRTCALSALPLEPPVVADDLGHLFNKIAILTALSERNLPERLSHVRGLKDLIDCRLTPLGDDAAKEAGGAEYFSGETAAVCCCPITREALDGSKGFVVVRTTGWVLSENAVEKVGAGSLQDEYGPFEKGDLVRIAPDEEQLLELRTRLNARREDEKTRRKQEKRARKKRGPDEDADAEKPRESKAAKAERRADAAGALARKTAAKNIKPESEYSRMAAQAKQHTTQHLARSENINSIFHDGAGKEATPIALFMQTSGKRYNLN